MQSRTSENSNKCKKHNKILEYIDLQICKQIVYKCQVCINEISRVQPCKIFQNQEQIEKFKQKDILLINEVKMQLKDELSKQDKQSYKEYKATISNILNQLDCFCEDVDIRMIKNIIFNSCFKNQLIQQFTFPELTNINSNIIQFYNKLLLFGTQDGYLYVFSINKNKITVNLKISQMGIVVLIKDVNRQDYFFVSGYEGNIIECQLKNKKILSNLQSLSSINQTHQNPSYQGELNTIEIEKNLHFMKKCDNNQSIKDQNKKIHLEEQKNNIENNIDDDENIDVKVYRKFRNYRQIWRMVSCMDGRYISAGVGKKIVLWNVKIDLLGIILLLCMDQKACLMGIVNLLDISKQVNPLVTQFKFQHSNHCTRVKKINENEFLVLVFPKRVLFFKIIQEKKFITQTIKLNNNIPNEIGQISPKLKQLNSNREEEDDIYDIINQDNQYISLKTKKSSKHIPAGLQVNNEQNEQKNLKLQSIEYNIIKTGEVNLFPEIAFNINVFDNYLFNINGDYNYSFLIDYNQYKDINSYLNLSNTNNNNQSLLTLLQYNDERVLTSILLENITINSQTYKNVVVNMPRNQQTGEEVQKPSLNLCFFA